MKTIKKLQLQRASLYFLAANLVLTIVLIPSVLITRQIFLQEIKNSIDTTSPRRDVFLVWIASASFFFYFVLTSITIMAVYSIEKRAKEFDKHNSVVNQMILAGELSSFITHEFKNLIYILVNPLKKQVTEALNDAIFFGNYFAQKMGVHFSVKNLPVKKTLFFHGNQVLLTQILLNLIKNSCEAVEKLDEKDRWICLDISAHKDLIRFQVIDGGKGLSEKNIDDLFKTRFTTKGAGTGLGLSVSHKFTMLQNGQLEYLKDQSNTTFTVTLNAA